jgi:cobalamin synthase
MPVPAVDVLIPAGPSAKTMPRSRRKWWQSRWWMPSISLLLGALVLAAMWIGGDRAGGLKSFAVFVALAVLFALGGRSDTLRGLGGPGRDERWAMIDLRASAAAGVVVLVVLGGAWLWELANGDDGNPYSQILAIGGLSYILAIGYLRWRA